MSTKPGYYINDALYQIKRLIEKGAEMLPLYKQVTGSNAPISVEELAVTLGRTRDLLESATPFFVSPPVVELVSNTDVTAFEPRLPYPVTAFEYDMPDDYVEGKEQPDNAFFPQRRIILVATAKTAWQDSESNQMRILLDEEGDSLLLAPIVELPSDLQNRGASCPWFFPHLAMILRTSMIESDSDKSMATAVLAAIKESVHLFSIFDGEERDEYYDVGVLSNYVGELWFVLSVLGILNCQNVETETIKASPLRQQIERRKKRRKLPDYSTIKLSQQERRGYSSRKTGGGSHASPRTHWRRGHVRTQHYGKRREQTKKIWIKPTLIGVGGRKDSPKARVKLT